MRWQPVWWIVLFVLAVLVVVVPLARRKNTSGHAPDHARPSVPELPAETRTAPREATADAVVDAGRADAQGARSWTQTHRTPRGPMR